MWPDLAHATSSRFRILPLAVSGYSLIAMKYSGMSKRDRPASCRCRSNSSASARTPSWKMTDRHTFSPSRSSATAKAAQRATAGWRLVLVSGEAGVGKPTLLRRFCDACPAGARFLWGACDAQESRAGGAVVAEASQERSLAHACFAAHEHE